MGYQLNRLDELVFMAGPKPMRTEFGIHHRLESCEPVGACYIRLFKCAKSAKCASQKANGKKLPHRLLASVTKSGRLAGK